MDKDILDDSLREVQLTQLDMLIEFDKICKKFKLKYQLAYGTLLGAIRHKGFIPWDDDIDVVMLRSDYDKFLEACGNNLNSAYFLQNYSTDPKFHRQFTRLRKNNTRYVQNSYKNMDIHHGIFIDIFPLDNVKLGNFFESLRFETIKRLRSINRLRNTGYFHDSSFTKRMIGKAVAMSNKLVRKPTFDNLKSKIMKIHNKRETEYVCLFADVTSKAKIQKYSIKRSDFNDIIEWEFEGHNFLIPTNYHKILTDMYGDYMKLPPIEQRKPHHGIIELNFGSENQAKQIKF